MESLPLAASYPDSPIARLFEREGIVFDDPDKQLWVMDQVALDTPKTGLPQLQYGTRGYCEVTKRVFNKIDDFDYPDKIMHTVPRFAAMYYQAYQSHLQGRREEISGPWRTAFYNRHVARSHAAAGMMRFWGVHIGYDLGIVLDQTDTKQEHKNDYRQVVNTILSETAGEIWPQYLKVPNAIGKLGVKLALQEIFGARDEAWIAYEMLTDHRGDELARQQILQEMGGRVTRRLLLVHTAADYMLRAFTAVPEGIWSKSHDEDRSAEFD